MKIKSSLLVISAIAATLISGSASAEGHRGWERYHVYRNHAWGYVYHPHGWVIPHEWAGPGVSIGVGPVSLGWGYRPGWVRYHVYRNNSWGYVYHPRGWSVPVEWSGPRGGGYHVHEGGFGHGYAHGGYGHGGYSHGGYGHEGYGHGGRDHGGSVHGGSGRGEGGHGSFGRGGSDRHRG